MPLLDVDLTNGLLQPVELSHEVRARWIGGTGLGLYLLSQEITPGLRATDPDCPVFIMTGPLTGTATPQGSDWCVVTLNAEFPKNICASHAHGHFGARLRHAGWDGIILRGQAQSPVYLWIDDGEPDLRSAEDLWGSDTFETQRRLIGRHELPGREVSVACIGPAGENLVEGASVRCDWAYGANEGGAGVAWGAKRLKAVAVCGTRPVAVVDPERIESVGAEWREQLVISFPGFPESVKADGLTVMTPEILGNLGWIPGKNFTDPDFGYRWSERLGVDLPKWEVEALGSWNCDHACHWRATCTTGPMAGLEFSGYGGEVLEETGPNLGIDDPGTAFAIGGMVDAYGMAAKSAPRTIATLMQAFEAGAIGLEETDGIELTWGNHDSVMKLLDLTIKRDGIGELIAQGLRATARALNIEEFAVHMHGVGFNDHDLRSIPIALFQSQVVSGAGPTWQTILGVMMGVGAPDLGVPEAYPPSDIDHIAEVCARTQGAKLFNDSIGVCMLAQNGVQGGVLRFQTACVEAATGVEMSAEGALEAGDRIVALQRMLAIYLGYTPDDDFDLSDRLFEKIPSGPAAGNGITQEEFRRVRDQFYELQGWSLETGSLTAATIARLGLADVKIGSEQAVREL